MDKKIILGYTRRLLAIIPSIFFCALGVALLVSPEWGSDPLTTFEIGLSNVFHVQLGTAALVFEGIVFFVFLFYIYFLPQITQIFTDYRLLRSFLQ